VPQQRLPVQVGTLLHALLHLLVRLLAAHRLQVRSRAERAASAGEDRATQICVTIEQTPGLVHAPEHLGRERVLRLGAVHGHDRTCLLLDEGVG
jgi:hypothetical protein